MSEGESLPNTKKCIKAIDRDRSFFQNLSEEEKEQLIIVLHKIYEKIALDLKKLGLENYI
jgi:hypothetical protein